MYSLCVHTNIVDIHKYCTHIYIYIYMYTYAWEIRRLVAARAERQCNVVFLKNIGMHAYVAHIYIYTCIYIYIYMYIYIYIYAHLLNCDRQVCTFMTYVYVFACMCTQIDTHTGN